jgi:hypothetical protein
MKEVFTVGEQRQSYNEEFKKQVRKKACGH